MNTSPSTGIAFGYFTHLSGIGSPFGTTPPASQNETTALFTFFTEVETTRVILNGPLAIVHRAGTSTQYFDESPNGDWSSPDTFRDGAAVLKLDVVQQVIVNTVTGTVESATIFATVTEAAPFLFESERLRLAAVGDQFRYTTVVQPGPTSHLASWAVAIEPKRPMGSN